MSVIDQIYFKTAENMTEVATGSSQLVILTPPYVGHHSFKEKRGERDLLGRLLTECARVVTQNGVVVTVNTDFKDLGAIYLRHLSVIEAALSVGLLPKDEKIWIRGFKKNLFRKNFTFVFVFCKQKKVFERHLLEYEVDNWLYIGRETIPGFRDAIKPEIPQILIRNFTNKKDLVVSSCAGTGTVVIVALKERRRAIGYELNPKMKDLIIFREKMLS